MQTMCESPYVGPSTHSLPSNNGPTPNKHPRTSKNPSNDVIPTGKIHYLGPNKMILTYYEAENADPVLEDHFKRSLSASGQELKSAYAEQQRTKRVPPSFWTKKPRTPSKFSPLPTTSAPSFYANPPLPTAYPYPQASRYGPGRTEPSSSNYNPFLKPGPPPLNLYPGTGNQQVVSGRYGQSAQPQPLPGLGAVSQMPQPAPSSYGSFFTGIGPNSSRISATGNPYGSQSGPGSRGSDWVVPPPLGGPFGHSGSMDFGPTAPGFGGGILPPPAYGSFGPGLDPAPPVSSQESFLSSTGWTSFI